MQGARARPRVHTERRNWLAGHNLVNRLAQNTLPKVLPRSGVEGQDPTIETKNQTLDIRTTAIPAHPTPLPLHTLTA
jgi:hypothetical protein